MRNLPTAVAAHLAARRPMLVHALLWLSVRERTPARTPQNIGLWTGPDHQAISVAGQDRLYHAGGAILDLEPMVARAELEVRQYAIALSPLHAQVIEASRIHDARLAPAEIHLWYFDPATHNPLAPPVREFRGTVVDIDNPSQAEGGEAICTFTCASDAWRLTRGLTTKRSHEALLARTGGEDGFRRHNVTDGAVATAWGSRIDTGTTGGGGSPSPGLSPREERERFGP